MCALDRAACWQTDLVLSGGRRGLSVPFYSAQKSGIFFVLAVNVVRNLTCLYFSARFYTPKTANLRRFDTEKGLSEALMTHFRGYEKRAVCSPWRGLNSKKRGGQSKKGAFPAHLPTKAPTGGKAAREHANAYRDMVPRLVQTSEHAVCCFVLSAALVGVLCISAYYGGGFICTYAFVHNGGSAVFCSSTREFYCSDRR